MFFPGFTENKNKLNNRCKDDIHWMHISAVGGGGRINHKELLNLKAKA